MVEACATCKFSALVPAWRKRPRTSKWEKGGDIYECRRVPIFRLKLWSDWCGEYAARLNGGAA